MRIDWNVPKLKIQCAEGDLSLYRTNRGEPYQEGVAIQLEDGHDYRKSCAVFLEYEEAKELRNRLNQLLGEKP